MLRDVNVEEVNSMAQFRKELHSLIGGKYIDSDCEFSLAFIKEPSKYYGLETIVTWKNLFIA